MFEILKNSKFKDAGTFRRFEILRFLKNVIAMEQGLYSVK